MTNTNITIETLRQMNNEEILNLRKTELAEAVIELITQLNHVKMSKASNARKYEVRDILLQGAASIAEIAEIMGTSTKNVSSNLCYLKKEGYIIHTDDVGRKYLHATPQTEADPKPLS